MRVLWLCNIMLPIIADHLGREASNKEGWLSGICSQAVARRRECGLELGIAFPVHPGDALLGNPQAQTNVYSFTMDVPTHTMDVPARAAQTDSTECYRIRCYAFGEEVLKAHIYPDTIEESMRRIVDDFAPDLVHCFGTEYPHTLAMCRIFPDKNRVIVGMQGVCTMIDRAYLADLPPAVQKRVTLRDFLKKDSIMQQKEKFAIRAKSERLSLSLAGNAVGRTQFDRSYVEAIHPGIRYFRLNESLRDCFYEDCWSPDACEAHSIFVSQADYPLKGLHYLLIAAGALLGDYPDLQIRVAGDSLVEHQTLKQKLKTSSYGKYLRDLIREQGLDGRVHFLGRLTAEQMKAQYLQCGLFVCCSSNENSPNSLGEAMLLGVPCVAARVGGIPDLLEDGVDGILFDGCKAGVKCNNTCYDITDVIGEDLNLPADETDKQPQIQEKSELFEISQNLGKAIRTMWQKPDRRIAFGNAARNHAQKTHERGTNFTKMTEIYASVMAGTKL